MKLDTAPENYRGRALKLPETENNAEGDWDSHRIDHPLVVSRAARKPLLAVLVPLPQEKSMDEMFQPLLPYHMVA
jgi:hypothetical protein